MSRDKIIQYFLARDVTLRIYREFEQRNCNHVWNDPELVVTNDKVVCRTDNGFGWQEFTSKRKKRVCRICGKEEYIGVVNESPVV